MISPKKENTKWLPDEMSSHFVVFRIVWFICGINGYGLSRSLASGRGFVSTGEGWVLSLHADQLLDNG
jgi:uncharacterized MAPEG superfamily protein